MRYRSVPLPRGRYRGRWPGWSGRSARPDWIPGRGLPIPSGIGVNSAGFADADERRYFAEVRSQAEPDQPQMSPTVNPSGKGSSGSSDILRKASDPRLAEMSGPRRRTARRGLLDQAAGEYGAEDAFVEEVLVEAERPLAWSAAILAQVPVPHGERSIAPVQVAGRAQSSCR